MVPAPEVSARSPDAATLAETVLAAQRLLQIAGCETPRGDAQWIAAHVLGVSRAALYVDAERPFPSEKREEFENLVARRAQREPLAYVLGTVNFRGLELEVGPGTLVPRPETEVTAGRAIERARADGAER